MSLRTALLASRILPLNRHNTCSKCVLLVCATCSLHVWIEHMASLVKISYTSLIVLSPVPSDIHLYLCLWKWLQSHNESCIKKLSWWGPDKSAYPVCMYTAWTSIGRKYACVWVDVKGHSSSQHTHVYILASIDDNDSCLHAPVIDGIHTHRPRRQKMTWKRQWGCWR